MGVFPGIGSHATRLERISRRQDTVPIGRGWAASLTMGAGQFRTNPGVAVVIGGAGAEAFVEVVSAGVQEFLTSVCDLGAAMPCLYQTTGRAWLSNEMLDEEVFGPLAIRRWTRPVSYQDMPETLLPVGLA